MKDTKKECKSAAILTIKNAPNMTFHGKKKVSNWLRRQSAALLREGHNYSSRFTAHYLFR